MTPLYEDGIVCLIISVLGSTKTQNILHKKNLFGYVCGPGPRDFKNGVKKLVHLVKSYGNVLYMTHMVNPALQ